MKSPDWQRHEVQYGTTTIQYDLMRRNRKTLEINVQPDATVTVVAPFDAPLEAIHDKVIKRGDWIMKQRRYFADRPPVQPERAYIPGESHYIYGKQYLLKFKDSEMTQVELEGNHIVIHGTREPLRIALMLRDWGRSRLIILLYELVTVWAKKMNLPDAVDNIQVRRMEKRWGSCTAKGELIFNENLIKAPLSCIEYVVVHEMCHLIEPSHSSAFWLLLRTHLPDFDTRKQRLEETIA